MRGRNKDESLLKMTSDRRRRTSGRIAGKQSENLDEIHEKKMLAFLPLEKAPGSALQMKMEDGFFF